MGTTSKTAKQGSAPVTQTVVAIVPIEYDKAPIAVGESFEIRANDAAQLLAVGAIELTNDAAPDAPAA